jgi:hypothetical protein
VTGSANYHLGMVDPTWDGVIALVVGLLAFAIYRRQAKIAKMQASIAGQQKVIQEQQVRQGSFELRYDIYEATEKYIDMVLINGADVAHEDRDKFERLIQKAQFLFSLSTWDKLLSVRQSSENYIEADRDLRDQRRRNSNIESAEKELANVGGVLEHNRSELPSIFGEMRLIHGESMLGRAYF